LGILRLNQRSSLNCSFIIYPFKIRDNRVCVQPSACAHP
jgi:hypothetical protein